MADKQKDRQKRSLCMQPNGRERKQKYRKAGTKERREEGRQAHEGRKEERKTDEMPKNEGIERRE